MMDSYGNGFISWRNFYSFFLNRLELEAKEEIEKQKREKEIALLNLFHCDKLRVWSKEKTQTRIYCDRREVWCGEEASVKLNEEQISAAKELIGKYRNYEIKR